MRVELGQTCVRFGGWILAGWVALAAIGAAVLRPGPQRGRELRTFLPDDAPSVRATEAVQRHFPKAGGMAQAVAVFEREDRPLDRADFQAVAALAAVLRQPLPEAARPDGQPTLAVRAPGDLPGTLKPNPMISADGLAAIVEVGIPANFTTIQSVRVVDYIRQVMARTPRPAGLEAAVTGSAGYGRDYASAAVASHGHTLWATLVAVGVILLVVYRAPLAAAMVLGIISFAAGIVYLVLHVATARGLHVGTAESIFIYVLVYGVGVDYSLLYLSRFREMLGGGLAPRAAAAAAWSATAPAVAASTGTTLAGLAMLSAARFKVFQTTGQAVPIALVAAMAVALTATPAATALLHRRLFWPCRSGTPAAGGRRLWTFVADLVTRRPRWVLAVTLAALVIPAVLGAQQRYDYDTVTGLAPRYEAVRGMRMARRHWPVGQITPLTIVLETAADASPEVAQAALTYRLNALDGVAEVRSLAQPLGPRAPRTVAGVVPLSSVPALRAEYLGNGATLLVVALDMPAFTDRAMATLAAIRQAAQSVLPAGAVHISGATAEMADIRTITQRDFYTVAGLALAAILLIVIGLLRDAVLAAFMVASTVLSYLATLGLAWGVFVGLLGQAGLDWKVEVFVFVVMVAVGQDYNIFLAARLAEESRHRPPREAAHEATLRTGGIISSAGLIMAATLGSLMAGELVLLRQLGLALAMGMLLDTFVVRPLLLPSFAVLTGRTGRPFGR